MPAGQQPTDPFLLERGTVADERHQDIPERLFDANLQVVTAVHIPTMLATSELSGELREAIEGGRWNGLAEVGKAA